MTNLVSKYLALYLVTDPELCRKRGLVQTVMEAVSGGVTSVQLRDKNASTRELVEIAIALKRTLDGTGVPVIVNDNLEAAVAADADGAHIGQNDQSPEKARAILGPRRILGLSCETPDAVRRVDTNRVDYLGLGPIFHTATKKDLAPPVGLLGLAEMAALTELPSVAIGGLKANHVNDVQASGACGLAVVSAICGQPDPREAALLFKNGQCA